jgi:hypothetical protein
MPHSDEAIRIFRALREALATYECDGCGDDRRVGFGGEYVYEEDYA